MRTIVWFLLCPDYSCKVRTMPSSPFTPWCNRFSNFFLKHFKSTETAQWTAICNSLSRVCSCQSFATLHPSACMCRTWHIHLSWHFKYHANGFFSLCWSSCFEMLWMMDIKNDETLPMLCGSSMESLWDGSDIRCLNFNVCPKMKTFVNGHGSYSAGASKRAWDPAQQRGSAPAGWASLSILRRNTKGQPLSAQGDISQLQTTTFCLQWFFYVQLRIAQ